VGELRIVTDIAAPVDVCFDLSRSIDLHVESMVASQERAVAGVTSGLIGAGERVTWEARHLGRHWRVTSRITEYDRPRRFVDEMEEGGPFASFRHEHLFQPHDGGTRMRDVIRFRTRCGPLTLLADIAASAYLRRLMARRNATIRSRAEAR
jgi:ligand-binding SRPBCC domain-containing protein